MNYQDRGIMKYKGFFLSEHSRQMNQKNTHPVWREGMSPSSIENTLQSAICHHASVVIQKKSSSADNFPDPDIIGLIVGYEGDCLYIRTKQKTVAFAFSDIHHITEDRSGKKWYM